MHQESPNSERDRSFWASWLPAHTGVDGFDGILGVPFLGMMEHSSEMPKAALTRKWDKSMSCSISLTRLCRLFWSELDGRDFRRKLGVCTASASLGWVLGSCQHPLLISGDDFASPCFQCDQQNHLYHPAGHDLNSQAVTADEVKNNRSEDIKDFLRIWMILDLSLWHSGHERKPMVFTHMTAFSHDMFASQNSRVRMVWPGEYQGLMPR